VQIKEVLFHWIPLARKSAVRFPFTILNAIACAALSLLLIWVDPLNSNDLEKCLWILSLGISLFTAAALLPVAPKKRPFTQIATVLILAFLLWFHRDDSGPDFQMRLVALFLAGHLAAAIAPFLWNRDQLAFWRFNQKLFVRAILTAIYTGLLYGGIAVAVWSLDPLFGLKIDTKVYVSLWAVIAYVVSVLFFLAGVPEKPSEVEPSPYPAELRVLVPNVALPLIAVYFSILYIYAAKILFTRVWPSGKIGWLISSLSFVVILSNLLTYPIAEDRDRPFVRWLSKNAYRLLLPLMIILFLAVWERVESYGWTEARFALLILGLWTTFVAATSVVTKKRIPIFWVPASLFIVTVIAAYGPLNMFNVSRRSQETRIARILSAHGYQSDGKTGSFSKELAHESRKALSSSLEFLCEREGVSVLRTVLNVDFKSNSEGSQRSNWSCLWDNGDAARAMKAAGTTYPRTDGLASTKMTALRYQGRDETDLELQSLGIVYSRFGFYDRNLVEAGSAAKSAKEDVQTLSSDGSTMEWNKKTHEALFKFKGHVARFDLSSVVSDLVAKKNAVPLTYNEVDKTPPMSLIQGESTLIISEIWLEEDATTKLVSLTNLSGAVFTQRRQKR
jgi:Domain of unknown function (DUF4153)